MTTTTKMIVDVTIIAAVVNLSLCVTYTRQLLILMSGHVAMFGKITSANLYTAWKSAKFGNSMTSITQDA
jgi:hypothetical protein